jgi:hypothetical protein
LVPKFVFVRTSLDDALLQTRELFASHSKQPLKMH